MSLEELKKALLDPKPKKIKNCMRFSESSYSKLLRLSELTGETTSRVLNELLRGFLFRKKDEESDEESEVWADEIKACFDKHKAEQRKQAIIFLDADVVQALEYRSRKMLLQPKMVREYVIDTTWQEVEASVSSDNGEGEMQK